MINSDTFLDSWLPCVIAIEDHYVPIIAAPLLRGLHGLDDESAAITITLWAEDAVVGSVVN